MLTVLANGVFDVLHIGHLLHLEEARRLGGQLIVALTVDEFVNKGPGLPLHTWNHRAALLRGLRCVDEVIPSVNAPTAIRTVRPDIFVKGVDYLASPLLDDDRAACADVGALLWITVTPKYSSREIIERMKVLA